MIAWWFAWCLAAEPVQVSADAAPIAGKLAGKDARDAEDRPYDAYVVDAPAGVWIAATVRDYAFPLRVRVGDTDRAFEPWFADDAVVYGWSAGGPLPLEVGSTDKSGAGAYTLSIAPVTPATSEPPTVEKLPPYVVIEPTDWHLDGWFCELVTVRVPEATTLSVSIQAEDTARMRLVAASWTDGAPRVEADALPDEGARRPPPLELALEASVPRVFGACRDRLGTSYLEVRTPQDHLAPGTVIDATRRRATLDEAAALVKADLEAKMTAVSSEEGTSNRYEPVVLPLFLQSGLSYEMYALTEDDAYVPVAKLYLAYCDATCEAFAARSGMAMTMDRGWYVLDLPDAPETQPYQPPHTERWTFTWPEGTSLTASLQVYVQSVASQKLRLVVGEE